MPTDSQRAFTDDTLHAMEMDAEAEIEMNGTYEISGDDFYALLTRLGAAERYAEAGKSLLYDDHKMSAKSAFKVFDEARAEWRKIAGKEE